MKASDVVIGNTYKAKVSGKLVEVRIVQESNYPITSPNGYHGLNLSTGREVFFRSARRLRPR